MNTEPMTPKYMAEVVNAAIQCMQANSLAHRAERLQEVRDQLAAAPALSGPTINVGGIDSKLIDGLRAQLAAAEAALAHRWECQQSLERTVAALRADLAAAEAERDRAVKDAERYRWLRDHKCNSLHLTRDGEHACNYMTAAEWIDEEPQGWFADDPPEAIEAMKAANTIWTLQIYPDTPIGFIHWDRATLDEVIDAAIASAAGEDT